MTAQVTNALTSLPTGLAQPAHGFGSKKDDDGFDSALGMAMFAIPPSIAMPSQAANSGRHGSAGSADASSVDGVSAVDGDLSRLTAHSTAQADGRATATVGDSVGTLLSHSAATDGGTSIAQSANGQVGQQGQAQAFDDDAGGSTSVTGADAKSFENIAGGAFAGSVEITYRAQAASDSPLSGQISPTAQPSDPQQREIDLATTGSLIVDPSAGDPAASVHDAAARTNQDLATQLAGQSTPGAPLIADGTPAFAPPKSDSIADGTPALAPPKSDPIADGTPAFAPPKSDPIADGTPAFAPPKPGPIANGIPAFAPPKAGHAPLQSGPATGKSFQDSVADLTGSASPVSADRARALQAEAATTPASHSSQPKPASTPSNIIAGEERPASTGFTARPNADAAGQPSPVSDHPSLSTSAASIQASADGLSGAALAANNKRNLASRTASDMATAHSSGTDGAGTPALTNGRAEGGGGAAQTTASAAVTLRTFAPPASDTRVANLTVDLAGGQTTHATVREHLGAVDVKIVTSSQQNAQVIGSELPALRRALDAAGMQLKAADVSHQGDGQRGNNSQQQENQSPRSQSGDSTTFAIEEVNL